MRSIIHHHCTFKVNWGKCSLTLMLSFSQQQAHEMSCKSRWADRSHWHIVKTNTHMRARTHVHCTGLAAYFAYSTDSRWNFQQKRLPRRSIGFEERKLIVFAVSFPCHWFRNKCVNAVLFFLSRPILKVLNKRAIGWLAWHSNLQPGLG